MATIEQIAAQIIEAGIRRKFSVVPEFSIFANSQRQIKKLDIAWLTPRKEPSKNGSLAHWKIHAAFEIEGYDVSISRVRRHAEQIKEIQSQTVENFPCYLVLYNEAHHRINTNWGSQDPGKQILRRTEIATQFNGSLEVRDGRFLEWLELA